MLAINKIHLKGVLWGGAVALLCVMIWMYVGMPYFLVVVGGFISIYVIKDEITVGYIETLKVGGLTAVIPAAYILFILSKVMKDAKEYILEHGIEKYISENSITDIDPQSLEDQIVNHTYSLPLQLALIIFILTLTGAWIALIFYKPRKKMH
jgi:asparagine N-glycosylation enzyme membrane subunit Stt3